MANVKLHKLLLPNVILLSMYFECVVLHCKAVLLACEAHVKRVVNVRCDVKAVA